mgnify:CR=1 FL=1
MATEEKPLTDLLAEKVGDRGEMSYRTFRARAIDPVTGHQPTLQTIWKIVHGEDIKAQPSVFRALAAGLGRDEQDVLALAARQYTGYVVSDPFGRGRPGVDEGVVHRPGMSAGDMPKNRTILERWDDEDREEE